MKRIVTICALLFGFLYSTTLEASHIVGGEMSYECIGNNQYRITLNVYRDCQSTNQQGQTTPFDNNASITIYRVNNSGIYIQHSALQVPLQTQTNINIDLSNPCLIPPSNVCVDRGYYETTQTLPFNQNGYVISYQRCCRNNSISNIGNPGQTGATYTIYLSDLAQTGCNTSPQFNNFPPVVVCNNEPIDFDHGATDADGDSLVYSFCTPFVGASPMQPQPNTASAPPYAPVSFNSPYTASAPLAGVPTVTINPTTGFITGSPQAVGQYVVGVCVDEYRNGVWLSSTQRDFQFNVTTCAVSLTADILEDSITTGGGFIVTSCDDTVITFQNQSGQAQFIDGYLWEFNMNNGTTFTSTATNPTVSFPGDGTYIGTLIVNPNSTDCTDTAYVIARISRSPVAGYSYVYDSCVIGPINFSTLSYGLDAPIGQYIWEFGDDSTMRTQDPSYQYQDAGTFTVTHTVIDTFGCSDQTQQTVTWAPTPIIDIVPSVASGCTPLEVYFENNSYPINGYTLFWTLGDGFTSIEPDPTHTYNDTGLYTVTVTIVSPLGCTAKDTFVDLINVRNSPIANFYTVYDSCDYGPVAFYNTSQEGDGPIISWDWDFKDGQFSTDTSVIHQYDTAGTYHATLTITDINDCVVTKETEINWFPAPVFEVAQPQYNGCEPLTVNIENTSYPLNGYFTLWNLGDGFYSDQASPTHTYEDPGTYSLTLQVITPTGCFEEQQFDDLVVVNPNPEAAFSYMPERPTNFDPTVQFSDESIDAVAWEWHFGDGATSIEQNPTHVYADTGIHEIMLVVTHPQGCQDTLYQNIDIVPEFTYFLPNAFTPNDDGKNDGYRGVGELFAVSNYKMQIWSRWGEMMFESNDPTEAWNGRKNNNGGMVQNGVYVCVVTLTGPRGQTYEYKTFATVVR